MSIDLQNVLPAVIVKIDKPAAPGNVLVVDSNPRRKRNIAKTSVSIVVIEVASIVRKVRLKNIKPSVAVVVGNRDTHPSLLVAILAVGAARCHSYIRKRAIVVVVKQDAGL